MSVQFHVHQLIVHQQQDVEYCKRIKYVWPSHQYAYIMQRCNEIFVEDSTKIFPPFFIAGICAGNEFYFKSSICRLQIGLYATLMPLRGDHPAWQPQPYLCDASQHLVQTSKQSGKKMKETRITVLLRKGILISETVLRFHRCLLSFFFFFYCLCLLLFFFLLPPYIFICIKRLCMSSLLFVQSSSCPQPHRQSLGRSESSAAYCFGPLRFVSSK